MGKNQHVYQLRYQLVWVALKNPNLLWYKHIQFWEREKKEPSYWYKQRYQHACVDFDKSSLHWYKQGYQHACVDFDRSSLHWYKQRYICQHPWVSKTLLKKYAVWIPTLRSEMIVITYPITCMLLSRVT